MLDESIWHTLNCMTLFGSTAQGKVVEIMDQLRGQWGLVYPRERETQK